MDRFLKVIISFTGLMIVCIVVLILLIYFKSPGGKPIFSTEEKIKKLNDYVNNSLYASENNMYLKIYSSNSLLTLDEFPELKEIVSDLNHSIKIKEEYKTDKFEYDKPQRIYFSWGDIKIILDIDTNFSSNLIYIENDLTIYKAEASVDSLHQISEFMAKFEGARHRRTVEGVIL